MPYLYGKSAAFIIVLFLVVLMYGAKKCEDKIKFVKEVKKNEKIVEKRQKKAKEEADYFIKQQKKEVKSVKKEEKAFKNKIIRNGLPIPKKGKQSWDEIINKKLSTEERKKQTDKAIEEFKQGL